ncbi:MAG: leucine-rich repeat domain-containing protein [Lachnospiraceae bacterium]|nr:leucine-rich repeat domain-containing protein [Lachnospiraceae bacterium]
MKPRKISAVCLSGMLLCSLTACSANQKLIDTPMLERYGLDLETGEVSNHEVAGQYLNLEEPITQEVKRDENGNRIVAEAESELFLYRVDGDNAVITGITASYLREIKIPASLDGHKVIGIEGSVFAESTALEYVELPEGMTYIGERVFEYCLKLEEVKLPGTLTSIGTYAFSNCIKLESLKLPDSITKIGSRAFSGCESLKEITVPAGVTKIEEFLFANCTSLEAINLPETLKDIEQQAFQHCSSLKEIKIPERVTAINIGTFYGCTSLETITIPASVVNIYPTAFKDCNMEHISVVTSSGSYAEKYANENGMIASTQ